MSSVPRIFEPSPWAIDGAGLRKRSTASTVLVLAVHLLMGWMLLQVGPVQQAVKQLSPVVVRLLDAPPWSAPLPLIRPAAMPVLPAQTVPLVPPPLVEITPAAPTITVAVAQITPREAVAALAPAVPVPSPVPLPVAVPAAVLPPPAPAMPALKQIAPGALRYRVEPRMTVPLMSRRLHESGVVVLRIAVDVRGLLKAASVHKSSGFERLDQQALLEIRSARFVPQTENGQPIEWETLAPMSYELD